MSRRIAVLVVLVLGIGCAGSFVAGSWLIRSAHRTLALPDLPATDVSFRSADGLAVGGWFLRGRPGRGVVLLLHGLREDRWAMQGRARMFVAAGRGVLAIDLPAHGESGGERITFGRREAVAVDAAMAWLAREVPGERIGVVGVSLGAAAAVFAHPDPKPAAMVVESLYPTIEEAVDNRLALHLGPMGPWLAPLLLVQLPWRLDLTASDLRPIDALATLDVPVLVVSGAADRHTTLEETRRLFAAAREPKALWIVDGAAHVDLYRFAPDTYGNVVDGFLDHYLTKP